MHFAQGEVGELEVQTECLATHNKCSYWADSTRSPNHRYIC